MGAKRIYQAVSPYPQAAVDEIDYTQTADVMFLAHLDYAPRKLVRYGHSDWRFVTITWGPTITPPTGHSVVATNPNSTGYVAKTYKYVVTRISDGSPVQESRASTTIQVSNDLTLNGNFNTITVPAPSGNISRHVIYKEQGGIYGYIGATEGTSFVDNNIQPILSETPPKGENPFSEANKYPAAVTLHQQRTTWGATREVINGVFMSRSADLENMDRARPARADDSISFALMAEKVNGVTHLVSVDELLVFTTDAVWSIQGGESGAVTPAAINPKRQLGRGASRIKPLLIDKTVFFKPSKGNSIRALGFSFEIEGYKSDNVAIFSPHLFEKYGLVKMVFQEEPFSCIWAVRTDGMLLCFTWEQEQQVWGWSTCPTDGFVENLAVISEGGNDRLYILVRRTINGVERKFIERMALPHTDILEALHLDCAYTQVTEDPTNVLHGAWHLEGASVSAVADGALYEDLYVSNGSVTLPANVEARNISIGLRYTGEIETLPFALNGNGGSAHVNRQQLGEVVVRTIDTRGIEIGQGGGTALESVEFMDGEDVTELTDVSAKDYRVTPESNWTDNTTIRIEQNVPLPAHVVAIYAAMKVSSK